MNSALNTPTPIATIRRVILAGKLSEDVAPAVKAALRLFHAAPALYDTPGLAGPAKQAELVLKLAYWLVLGRLTAGQFREWVTCIPPEDNAGWDVDLRPDPAKPQLPPALWLGQFYPPDPAPAAPKA